LGRRLVEKQERVKIFGEEFVRRADVQVLNGFSAHADHDEIMTWFGQVHTPRLQHVFVVHGEEAASMALAKDLAASGVPEVKVPELREQVVV
jgi:metallo-beta-lactamase family protein